VEALGYKADVKSRAKDKVTETKDRITGKVSDVTGTVTGSVTDKAPDTQQVRRAAGIAQENPLGLALGGVAVGFVVGLLVPSSRVEDEKLGPMADQVKDQVKETGQEAFERGKEVAQQTVSSAKETAEEAGREHAEQLRGSAQERAQTVGTQ
jgi:ElaB/YqjD/DUF883 family membrane-anchored ribosome-binding protein